MNKKTFLIIIIIISILFSLTILDFASAQEKNSIDQQVLQIYKVSSNKIDTLINFIAMIATIFGIIIAIVVGFFAIRQFSVDREIKEYKEEIKKQKELIKEESAITKKELNDLRVWAKGKKNEIEKILTKPTPKRTKQQLKKIEEELDKLREQIAFKQGSLSTIPEPKLTDPPSLEITPALGEVKTCRECGKLYIDSNLTTSTISTCPYCGNINKNIL